jgi:CDP-diacylglycerol--serine O-phosphatidyltransferase
MSGKIRSNIPNAITCLNLFSGCLAVLFILRNELNTSALLVAASLFFDFMDGYVARLLNAQSAIGKQLDSLADMVTFGLMPGLVMHQLIKNSVPLVLFDSGWKHVAISSIPFIITVFSAVRLAKFNLDKRQNDGFLGLPTPACTIFVFGLALAMEYDTFHITPLLNNTWVLAGISFILSWLMISEIPMLALKFKNWSLKKNLLQYLLIISTVSLLCFMGVTGIPLVIVLYITLSLVKPPPASIPQPD